MNSDHLEAQNSQSFQPGSVETSLDHLSKIMQFLLISKTPRTPITSK